MRSGRPRLRQSPGRKGVRPHPFGGRVSLAVSECRPFGAYGWTPAARIAIALDHLFGIAPDVVLLQELSDEMLRAVQAVLHE